MLRHLFISIFKGLTLIIAIILFILPVKLADDFALKYSGQQQQMGLIHLALENIDKREVLLLGDSTIRNLHSLAYEIEFDSNFINLGVGGSVSEEWFYLLRSLLEKTNSVRVVVFGMSNGLNMKSSFSLNPYLPYLMSTKDLFYDVFIDKRKTLYAASKIFFYQRFKTLRSREEVLFNMSASELPSMKPFFLRLLNDQLLKSSTHLDAFTSSVSNKIQTQDGEFFDIDKAIVLAKKYNLQVVFMLSPAHSLLREQKIWRDGHIFFRQLCERWKIHCLDLSSSMDDSVFEADRAHVKKTSLPVVSEKILEFLQQNR